MWRFLQGIPRALRGQWNSSARTAPQTLCCDEEGNCKGKQENGIDVEQGKQAADLYSAEDTQQALATATRISTGENREEHQQRFSEDGKEHGPDKDNWFQEWLNRFRYNCAGTGIGQPHTAIEAVGWGTALLLGTQFGHFNGKKKQRYHKHDQEHRGWNLCPLQQLRRAAVAMPIQNPGSLGVVQFLGATQTSSTQQVAQENARQQAEAVSCETSSSIQPHGTKSPSSTPTTSQTEETTDTFEEAEKEWSKLLTLHRSSTHNLLGYQYAQKGQHAKAVEVWSKAGQAGYAKSFYNLGLSYEMGKSVPKSLVKAVEHYQKAADSGHAKAMYNLGVLHLQGSPEIPRDPEKAVSLLEKAASGGLRKAQTELGVLYTEEEHRDMKKATSLFEKAAEQEDARAQFYLGICLEQGWGIEQNEEKAAELYKRASASGHAEATYNLAVFHEQGKAGIKQNKLTALHLYRSSAKEGYKSALSDVNRLAEEVLLDIGQNKKDSPKHNPESKSPGLGTATYSLPVLGDHLHKQLMDFGVVDWDVASRGDAPRLRGTPMVPRGRADVKPKATFYIGEGDDDLESMVPQGTIIHRVPPEAVECSATISQASNVDSAYSSFSAGGDRSSRSCSLKDLSTFEQERVPSMHMVSCT